MPAPKSPDDEAHPFQVCSFHLSSEEPLMFYPRSIPVSTPISVYAQKPTNLVVCVQQHRFVPWYFGPSEFFSI